MKKLTIPSAWLAAAALTALLPLIAHGADRAVESTAAEILLPTAAPPSTLSLTPCRKCPPVMLFTTARTVYLINEQPVQLAELRARLAGRPTTSIDVTYDDKTRELRKVHAFIY